MHTNALKRPELFYTEGSRKMPCKDPVFEKIGFKSNNRVAADRRGHARPRRRKHRAGDIPQEEEVVLDGEPKYVHCQLGNIYHCEQQGPWKHNMWATWTGDLEPQDAVGPAALAPENDEQVQQQRTRRSPTAGRSPTRQPCVAEGCRGGWGLAE